MGGAVRIRARRTVVVLACTALIMSAAVATPDQALAAQSKGLENWTADMDCAACHVAQAESLAPLGLTDSEGDLEGVSDGAVPADEATTASDAAAGKTGGEKAVISATQGAKASDKGVADSDATGAEGATDEEADGDVDTDADDVAAIMLRHPELPCTSCHTDLEGLEKAHAVGDMSTPPTRLDLTTVTTKTCLSCHGTWEDLAEKTTESTVCTDSKGTTVNPHGAPETHVAASGAYLKCRDCHSVHEEQDVAEESAKTCQSCHHKDLYQCNICH